MPRLNKQLKEWNSGFGDKYTDRCNISLEEHEAVHQRDYGITRTELNNLFIGDLSRDINILEVGTNIGLQLSLLQKMGFNNLFGIEINSYAIELAKSKTKGIKFVRASALDIPFKDNYFDLVFTSGVLIHIAPSSISRALQEIYRCTKSYIWGFEYYADDYTEMVYRQKKNLLWKANFPKLYLEAFPDLELVREKKLPYLHNGNIDTVFLLKKTNAKNIGNNTGTIFF